MKTVLGIDAAWTAGQPSGVALVQGGSNKWRVLAAAPSYELFEVVAQQGQTNWSAQKLRGSKPSVASLVTTAEKLADSEIHVVSIDMPLSTAPITGRREADRLISKTFGSKGCSTHSPSALRPGPLGHDLMAELNGLGYSLDMGMPGQRSAKNIVEVYPHTGLLELLGIEYRLPYKVSKSSKYWPKTSVGYRIARLLEQFELIYVALEGVFGSLPFDLPAAEDVKTLTSLKRYEDVLDALVCAWVGRQYLDGQAFPYGDDTAAIWVPEPVVG